MYSCSPLNSSFSIFVVVAATAVNCSNLTVVDARFLRQFCHAVLFFVCVLFVWAEKKTQGPMPAFGGRGVNGLSYGF